MTTNLTSAVVLGTSRSDGNTRQLVNAFVDITGTKIFDLAKYRISFFDYNHKNSTDDFLTLIEELISYEHLIFATPVYWYSMSAQMKVFFDRLSDLLTIEKELGRSLKGKSISVLSTGFDSECPYCFFQPFELTAEYLSLQFKGVEYLSVKPHVRINDFEMAAERAAKSMK